MSEAGEVELFGADEPAGESPAQFKQKIEISSRELMGLIASELLNVAERIDDHAPWPLSAMSVQNLNFLQSLDRRAQHLRECAKLLEKLQAQVSDDFTLSVDSSLEAIASLLSQRAQSAPPSSPPLSLKPGSQQV